MDGSRQSNAADIRLPRGIACALLVGLALFPGGCKSSSDHRRDADHEVYALVTERRAKLALGSGTFTIEPNPASLRQRILRGETDGLEPITLVQCLEIAAENSREYQRRKEALYLVALDLTLERFRFQLQTKGTLGAIFHGTGGDVDSVDGSGFSLSKLLGSGALIVGDIGLSLVRGLTSGDLELVSDVGASITQPLLRGAGSSIVKEPLTQAERDLVYGVRTFERFRRTFAVDVSGRYYRLLQRMDAVRNEEMNYENLKQLTERNQALADAGRLSDIEVGQARQDELRSRNSLLVAREALGRDRDDFKLFLGLPIVADLQFHADALAELSKADRPAIAFAESVAIDYALANRLDYLTATDREADGVRVAEVRADALRAGLDVTASVDLSSAVGKPGKFNFEDRRWSAGAVLDLPLERLPERNAYREALIAAQASERARDELADSIRADLRDELRSTDTRRESYLLQLSAVELAERRIESTRLKLDAGRAGTRDLLEAQESLVNAQNAATQALIEYTLARLSLFRDLELLRVDESGVHMDEERLLASAAGGGAGANG